MTHDELMIQTGEAMAAWHKDKSTKIECRLHNGDNDTWKLCGKNNDMGLPIWDINYYYRIAKVPVEKWVPWTEEDYVVGRSLQHAENRYRWTLIVSQEMGKINLGDGEWMSLRDLFNSPWRQAGGDPCGKKVVE